MRYSKDDFIEFCRKGYLEKVKECVKQGIKPNIRNNLAIRCASLNGHLEVVKYLASLDSVDPGAYDNKAIRNASFNGHLKVFKYLVSIGAYRKGLSKTIDKYVIERQLLIILCLNRKLKCTFDEETYKLFMKNN